MPHHLLQCCNPHVLIRFVRAERVTKRMHTDPFPDAGLFHILGRKQQRYAKLHRGLQ